MVVDVAVLVVDQGRVAVVDHVDQGVDAHHVAGAQAGAYFSNRDDASRGEARAEEYGLYTSGGARSAFAKLPSDKICAAVFEQGRVIRSDDIADDPAVQSITRQVAR